MHWQFGRVRAIDGNSDDTIGNERIVHTCNYFGLEFCAFVN